MTNYQIADIYGRTEKKMKNSNAVEILSKVNGLPLNENTKIYIHTYRDYTISRISLEITDDGSVIRLYEGEEVEKGEGGGIDE